MLADNRLAEIATWDKELLRNELQFLNDLDVDFDFPLSASTPRRSTSFSTTMTIPKIKQRGLRLSSMHPRCRDLVTYGAWASIGSIAAMRCRRRPMTCSRAIKRGWSLPILPTTCPSMVMSAGAVASTS